MNILIGVTLVIFNSFIFVLLLYIKQKYNYEKRLFAKPKMDFVGTAVGLKMHGLGYKKVYYNLYESSKGERSAKEIEGTDEITSKGDVEIEAAVDAWLNSRRPMPKRLMIDLLDENCFDEVP